MNNPGNQHDQKHAQIQIGEVVKVNFKDDNPLEPLTIQCKLLAHTRNSNSFEDDDEGTTHGDSVKVRPLDANIKRIPVKGEQVIIIGAPNSFTSKFTQDTKSYFYIDIVSLMGNPNHNSGLGMTDISAPPLQDNAKAGSYETVQIGNPVVNKSKNYTDPKLGENFSEESIFPLQPYEGDILMEGRFGQSIRFSSALSGSLDQYVHPPKWTGDKNSPIIVIRNGQPATGLPERVNRYIHEDINNDGASIYLTQTQTIPLAKASNNFAAASNAGLTEFQNELKGKQIILSSDRVVLNGRTEVILMGSNGVALSTPSSLSLDAGSNIEIDASRVNIGNGADEPLVLGNEAKDLLSSTLDLIAQFSNAVAKLTVGTANGPSTVPVNVAEFTNVSVNAKKIKAKLPQMLSDLAYTQKNPGTGEQDPDDAEQFSITNDERKAADKHDDETQLDPAPQTDDEKIITGEVADNQQVPGDPITGFHEDGPSEIQEFNGVTAIDIAISLNPAQLGQVNDNFPVWKRHGETHKQLAISEGIVNKNTGETQSYLKWTFHTVKSGESSTAIAEEYSWDRDTIWNTAVQDGHVERLSNGKRRLKAGAKIKVGYLFGQGRFGDVPFCAAGVSFSIRKALQHLERNEGLNLTTNPGSAAVYGLNHPNGKGKTSNDLFNLSSHDCAWRWGEKWTINNTPSLNANNVNNRTIFFTQNIDYKKGSGLTEVGLQKLNRIRGWKGAIGGWKKNSSSGHVFMVVDVRMSGDKFLGLCTCEFNTTIPGGSGDERNGGQIAFRYRSLESSSFFWKYPGFYLTDMTGIPGCEWNTGFVIGEPNIIAAQVIGVDLRASNKELYQ